MQKPTTPRAFVQDWESGKITLDEKKKDLMDAGVEIVSFNNTTAYIRMLTALGPLTTLDRTRRCVIRG